MNGVKKTIVETLALGGVGLLVALSVNSVRGGSGIQIGKNYFPAARMPVVSHNSAPPTPHTTAEVGTPHEEVKLPPSAAKHPAHEFREIALDDLVKFYEGTSEYGADWESRVLFVDARNDRAYAEGHIPGALQLDHYKLQDYIDPVLKAAEAVDVIIVYCNGGECEDSILTCRFLVQDFEVPAEKVRLYAGGWQDWKLNKMMCEGECKE